MIFRQASRKSLLSLLTFGALALNLLISPPASAQVAGATLSGTVTDPSGAVISVAQISIKNVATGVTRSVATNDAGFYTAPNLLPGTYEVTVTTTGFLTLVRSGVTLTVGAEQSLDLAMQVGQVSQSVHVTGEAPAVQLDSSTIGAVVDANTVVDLPLNGRSWTDLAQLEPAVNTIQTQVNGQDFTRPKGNRGFGNQ